VADRPDDAQASAEQRPVRVPDDLDPDDPLAGGLSLGTVEVPEAEVHDDPEQVRDDPAADDDVDDRQRYAENQPIEQRAADPTAPGGQGRAGDRSVLTGSPVLTGRSPVFRGPTAELPVRRRRRAVGLVRVLGVGHRSPR
jgi:hypothetical protein